MIRRAFSSAKPLLRRRRAILYVPGADQRKVTKSTTSKADTIVLDIEDGVALNRKQAARDLISTHLAQTNYSSEVAIRMNAVGSGLERDDLNMILNVSAGIGCIVVPKVQSSADVKYVGAMLDASPNHRTTRILACIESALGVLNLPQIVSSHPRLDGLVFAAEDYTADTAVHRSHDLSELYYPRAAVVTAAKAFRLQAIDLVCTEFKNTQTLRKECENGWRMGFTGKQCIHPDQVDTLHDVFVPSTKEVDYAKRVMDAYYTHLAKGVGAFDVDGKMVDMPVVKAAQRTLVLAGLPVKPLDAE